MNNTIKDENNGFWKRIINAVTNKLTTTRKGDVGIYCDELVLYSKNSDNDTLKHTYNAKIRVLGVYQNLVEIELVDDIRISDSTSDEITKLIQKNFPKFANPSSIKWEVKENENI